MLESHIIIATLPMAAREALAMRRPEVLDGRTTQLAERDVAACG